MKHPSIGRIAFGTALGLGLLTAPAAAMHWSIYAPDEIGYRYWLDRDSIVKKADGYTYVTWIALGEDSLAPTSPDGNHSAINCANGNSTREDGGHWVDGPKFTDAAYLFRYICEDHVPPPP